jgi:hypothetical protein
MSLKDTASTLSWQTIPKRCKGCKKAIYTVEEDGIRYQCSLFGKFKRDCEIKAPSRDLPKPQEILKDKK